MQNDKCSYGPRRCKRNTAKHEDSPGKCDCISHTYKHMRIVNGLVCCETATQRQKHPNILTFTTSNWELFRCVCVWYDSCVGIISTHTHTHRIWVKKKIGVTKYWSLVKFITMEFRYYNVHKCVWIFNMRTSRVKYLIHLPCRAAGVYCVCTTWMLMGIKILWG